VPKDSGQSIDQLGLADECRDALEASGIHTIEHLSTLTENDLLKLPLVRKRWLVSIERCLRVFDYFNSKSVALSEVKSIDGSVFHTSQGSLDDGSQNSGILSEQKPERHGAPWSGAEKEAVGESFLFGATVREIAKKHKRSQASIVFQLQDLEGRNQKIYLKLRSLGLLKSQSGYLTSQQSSISDSSLDDKVLNQLIDILDLTIRSENCLKSQKIYLIGDLVSKKEKDLLRIPNLGKTSILDIVRKLRRIGLALDTDLSDCPPFDLQDLTGHEDVSRRDSPELLIGKDDSRSLPEGAKNPQKIEENLLEPLWTILEVVQADLTQRELLVFQGRFGYSGEVLTLETIGKDLGVTRERVRQIQAKVKKKIRPYRIENRIIAKLNDLLTLDRKQPLYQALLGIEDSWFEGFEHAQGFLKCLINDFIEKKFYSFDSDLGRIVARCSDGLETALDSGKEIFSASASQQETLFYVKLRIDAVCLELNMPELSSLVFDTLRPLAYVVNEESLGMDARVVAYGKSVNAATLGVLHQNNGPMHFFEVAERMSDLLGRKIRPNAAQNALNDVGALRIGRGLYGFREHINISEEVAAEICDTAEEIIKLGPLGKQWHCHELIDSIEMERPDLPEVSNGHVLNVFLESSDDLEFFGRQVWGWKADAESFEKRVDVSEAVESILENAGRPLTTRQIKSELSRWRGTSSLMLQLKANERVVRIAPATFGLLDRDVPLSLLDQDTLLTAIVTHLTELGRGLSQDDLSDFLSNNGFDVPNPYLILTIAPREPRLNTYRGSVLGLSEWGESRHVSIRKAVEQAIEDLGGDAETDRLIERSSEIRGSEISRQDFYESLEND
jgi:hypothetical protein